MLLTTDKQTNGKTDVFFCLFVRLSLRWSLVLREETESILFNGEVLDFSRMAVL